MRDDELRTGELGFTHTVLRRLEPPEAPGLRPRLRKLGGLVLNVLRASAWTMLLGRAFLILAGLLVLAWIGRTATNHRSALASVGQVSLGPATSTSAVSVPVPASASVPAPAPPPLVTAAPTPPSSSSRARATAEDPVYVNHASAEELRRLPGVGPKRAQAIVALRQRMGRFQRVEDLLRVKGVGRTTLRKWRPLLRLDAPDGGTP